MKEVTLEELVYLPNFKIKVNPEQSKLIQEALFKKGYHWAGNRTIVDHLDSGYLIFSAPSLGCSYSPQTFDEVIWEEVVLIDKFCSLDFKTTQEIWEWLIAGGAIEGVHSGVITFLKEGNLSVSNESITNPIYESITNPKCWRKVVKKEWYEDIPEKGILCWCKDSRSNKPQEIVLVVEYRDTEEYPYITIAGDYYKYAIPLTNEEIKEFLYESK